MRFQVPFRASWEFSVMGAPSLQPFLKSYWLTPVQMTGQLSQSMQMWQYKCNAHDNYVRIFYFTCWIHYGYSLQDLRRTNRNAGSILSLRRLPGLGPCWGGAGWVRLWIVLWAHCNMVRGLFGVRPFVFHRLAAPPSPTLAHSPVSFPEDCFRPPANIEEFVSFGQEEGDDSMSISALEREDWVGWEPDQMIRQPIRQLGAPRPPRGSHEGSVEGCPGVGAYLESSRRACQE